jgi:hypothetical protein
MRLLVSRLLLFGWIVLPFGMSAQDDAPWWRQLFGQSEVEKVEEQDANEAAGSTEGQMNDGGEGVTMEEKVEAELEAVEVSVPEGTVSWSIPESIAALDSLAPEVENVVIPGFRIQLFMGRLDSARALRHHLLENDRMNHAVHLSPYPPLFGVQVGDFRTALSAHRAMGELRRLYPAALVVPAELSLGDAFPPSSHCIMTP